MTMLWAPVGALSLLALLAAVRGYPEGAPDEDNVCLHMIPGHKNQAPQTTPAPFTVTVSKDSFDGGDTLQVTVTATGQRNILGFLIQARRYGKRANTDEPVGYFAEVSGSKTICQSRHGNGLTHTARAGVNQLVFPWTAADPSPGHIQFRVTIVSDFQTFWVAERSKVIQDVNYGDLPFTDRAPAATVPPFPAIDTEECGKSKGCYRNPSGCAEEQCDIIMTWQYIRNEVDFEVSADTEGWVGVGLSEDKKMGKDDISECVWNEADSKVVIRQSHNVEGEKSNTILSPPTLGLSKMAGYKSNRRIRCRFTRDNSVSGHSTLFDLGADYHLLMAKGPVDDNGNKGIHVMEPGKYPYVSQYKLSLLNNEDISGTARYWLVKAHACLMLLAWMMCASVAVIMAKYYKPMWPNQSLCGERVWFAVHRGCMATTLICTVIAFILIFVHVGGYSQMPELPAKAHPILGIITTILCVINPLIALCRPSPKGRSRPIFNWIHWFIGTCGIVLATPTLFIGLNLPKAHVPWWATWVLVAFMLFHLIIELMLEIHGCMNSKKQKNRGEEFELRKKNDPRGAYYGMEPEPVGTRFKKTIISIYLFVAIVLGLVMIITVAVS